MNILFKTSETAKPTHVSDAKLIVPIAIVLSLVLIISTVLDIWGTQRELTHILEQESKALISSIESASRNAVESFELVEDLVAERLLNNVRFIEQLDYMGQLSETGLIELTQENDLFRAAIYDRNGNLIMSSRTGQGWGNIKPVSDELLERISQPGNEELVMGFRSNRFGGSNRYAVAKLRRKGGVVLATIDAQKLLDFRKNIGVGQLIQEIGKNEGIR